MQIIVLGAHRSGTSMVTRLINMMGAYFGMGDTSIGANAENPKGFWERGDVINVNDAILRHYGCQWDKLDNWQFFDTPAKKDLSALEPQMQAMQNILLEMDANRPWVMKDPRMCLTYPFWQTKLELPVIVCVYRNPQEVARSLKTRNDISLTHGMAFWEYYAVGVVNAMRNTPTIFVSHDALLAHPFETVQKLYEDLSKHIERGLNMPSEKEVNAFIDPSLYRSRAGTDALNDITNNFQKQLIAQMQGLEPVAKDMQKPSQIATDAVMLLTQYIKLSEKLEAQNQHASDSEQRATELANQLESERKNAGQIKERYEDILKKEREKFNDLQQSTSWKWGNKLVKITKALTFQKTNAA
jgi:hypothetical protein